MPRWLFRIRTPVTLAAALALVATSLIGVPGWATTAVVAVFLAGVVSLYLPGAGPAAGAGAVAGGEQPRRQGAQPRRARLRPDLCDRPGVPARSGRGLGRHRALAARPAAGRLPRLRAAGAGARGRRGGQGERLAARPLEP